MVFWMSGTFGVDIERAEMGTQNHASLRSIFQGIQNWESRFLYHACIMDSRYHLNGNMKHSKETWHDFQFLFQVIHYQKTYREQYKKLIDSSTKKHIDSSIKNLYW